MDHLPYPQNSPSSPVSIPYYDKFRFDGGSFTDYPTRCGFEKIHFAWGDFKSVPWDDQTAFLQAWLFFGLLHECLGAPAEEFIDRAKGVVTTERLPHWTQKFKKSVSFSRSKRQADYERVHAALRETCSAVTLLDSQAGRGKKSNLTEEVAFSVVVLGLTLDQVCTHYDLLTKLGGEAEEHAQVSRANVWPTTEFARKRLEGAGWCRSETLRLERYVKATGIYYCGSMQRMGPPIDHSNCGETGCAAENVVEETYVTRHSEDCDSNDCNHVGPAVSEVATILEADDLPILEMRRDASSRDVLLRVVPYNRSVSYTALSHVWADGLGNPHANTIPQCQISRLHGLLAGLSSEKGLKNKIWGSRSEGETVYIWMDTLLIPLTKKLRKKAISRMYDIYKNAKSVLVLDRSLLDCPGDRATEELLFRLSAASWMRRAWTLQEGALASKLYVQFKEQAVQPVKLAEKTYQRIVKSEPWNIILEECGTVINYITQSGEAGVESNEVLHSILVGLGQRSTSHPEDKEICFAVMLKMDMKKVLDAEGAQRTVNVVKQLAKHYIPYSFLWHSQPNLDVPGFSWLPKDIIASGGGVPEMGLSLTDKGLLVQNEALIFRSRTHYLNRDAHHVRDVSTGKWYGIIWDGDVAAIGERLVNDSRTWTTLAALPNRRTMFDRYHIVVLRLDWALDSPSSDELLRHTAGNATTTGEFIGRGWLQEVDDSTTEQLKAKTGVKRGKVGELREAIRSGESNLEGQSDTMKRVIEEEGDDSWYILDGQMQNSGRRWLVT